MLRGLRNASANWIGKTIMGLVVAVLVVSFAIWGIGDIFRGFGRSAIAKVGSTEIPIEQFRQSYNNRLQLFARQFGRDQARAFGIERQVLQQMLAEAALDERARQLRLGLSEAEISRRITSNRQFRGITGQFDRQVFENLLRQNGYTEARYVAEQRRLISRQQLAEAASGAVFVPKAALELSSRFDNERRALSFVVLDRSNAGPLAEPSPEQLASYFDSRKASFRAPEYRQIDLLVLTPDELATTIEVSDADATKRYEDEKARYAVPEKRELQRIVFPTEEEAKAAAEKLKSNEMNFSWLATERNLQERDINLGRLAKGEIQDKAIAEAAFALGENEISAPVQTQGGFALVRVGGIEPATTRSAEEALPEIRKAIALERARATLAGRHDKVEDERAGGSTLKEVGQKLGLPVRSIEAVDRSGRDPEGNRVAQIPGGVDVLTSVFAARTGVETEALQAPGGGFIWYEIGKITASRERSLDEVRPRVVEQWQADQVVEQLKAKANELVAKLNAGTSFDELAGAENLKVQTVTDLRRGGRGAQNVPIKVADEAFRVAKDAVGTAEGETATQRVVFRVTEITIPPLSGDAAELERGTAPIRTSLADDLLMQYVLQIENELGTTVNQEAVRRVVGGESN